MLYPVFDLSKACFTIQIIAGSIFLFGYNKKKYHSFAKACRWIMWCMAPIYMVLSKIL